MFLSSFFFFEFREMDRECFLKQYISFGPKISTFGASEPEKSRLLMETSVGFVPVSELVPDVCVCASLCALHHLRIVVLVSPSSLAWWRNWHLAVMSLLHVAEVRHDDPGLSKHTH